MAQNNTRVILPATNTAAEMITAVKAAFTKASGYIPDGNDIFWMSSKSDLGVKFYAEGDTKFAMIIVNSAGSTSTAAFSYAVNTEWAFTYNTSADGSLFAFDICSVGTANPSMKYIMCHDEEDTPLIIQLKGANAQVLYTATQMLTLAVKQAIVNENATTITMLAMPAVVTPKKIKQLYFVFSSPEISWSADSGVYLDGELYKACYYSAAGSALAFLV